MNIPAPLPPAPPPFFLRSFNAGFWYYFHILHLKARYSRSLLYDRVGGRGTETVQLGEFLIYSNDLNTFFL